MLYFQAKLHFVHYQTDNLMSTDNFPHVMDLVCSIPYTVGVLVTIFLSDDHKVNPKESQLTFQQMPTL